MPVIGSTLMFFALMLSFLPPGDLILRSVPVAYAASPQGDFGATWLSAYTEDSRDLAWGDFDNDGDLDLAIASGDGVAGRIYRNDDGSLTPFWEAPDGGSASAVAWGDYDSDGDLDLILGMASAFAEVYPGLYRNDDGVFTADSSWQVFDMVTPVRLLWGDIDGDADLDLLLANEYGSLQLYRNNNAALESVPALNANFIPASDLALADFDNDGDLDLVASYNTGVAGGLAFFQNNNGNLPDTPTHTLETDNQPGLRSVDAGDYDQDGDLDLLVADSAGAHGVRLYQNRALEDNTGSFDTMFSETRAWSDPQLTAARDARWADYDNDGDLDIAVAVGYGKNQVYRNDGNTTFVNAWTAPSLDYTSRIAWADVDGDGILDLSATNSGKPNVVYFNNDGGSTVGAPDDGGLLPYNGEILAADELKTEVVALGDYDNDGDLDLAVGNNYTQPSRIYRNDEGVYTSEPVWTSPDNEDTYDIDWVDYDNDGDLDMAAINFQQADALYRNDGVDAAGRPILTRFAVNSSIQNTALAGAWGDYDNDGDLDLAVANSRPWSYNGDYWYGDRQPNDVYRNDGVDAAGAPIFTLAWQSSTEADLSYDVEWGDIDADGDLDLVVANESSPNRLYLNDNAVLSDQAVWSSQVSETSSSVALADYDGDGDLDLAFGNRGEPNSIYRNDNGRFDVTPAWSSQESNITYDIAFSDYDNDGDLDLLAGNYDHLSDPTNAVQLYRNVKGQLDTVPVWRGYAEHRITSVAWGDVDNDGDQDLVTGNRQGTSTRLYLNRLHNPAAPAVPMVAIQQSGAASSPISAGRIAADPVVPIEYTLAHPTGAAVGEVRAFYSTDGGGHWLPALPTADTVTRDLPTAHQVTTVNTEAQSVAETASKPIADNGTLSAELNFAADGTLADLEPELTISHPRSRELSAELWAPWPNADGTTVRLFDNLASDGPNQVTLRFSDASGEQLPVGASDGATNEYVSNDVPRNLPRRGVEESTLTVSEGGTIVDVDVIDMHGRHNRMSDLSFQLRSPAGTEVPLMYRSCGGRNHFDLSFDDEGAGNWPCPPTDGGSYQPEGDLSAFAGEDSAGVWTLIVEDHRNGRRGRLNGWGLRITTESTGGPMLAAGTFQPAESLAAFNGMPADTPITLRISDSSGGNNGSLSNWSLAGQVTTEQSSPSGGGRHTFYWDTFASGLFGQSDKVVVRIEALPELRPTAHSASRSYSYGRSAAHSTPFRVRGTQVRVVDPAGNPVPDALVYRLPEGQQQGGEPIGSAGGELFFTDSQGYLPGRGQLDIGDRLLAIAPAQIEPMYIRYHTSGTPTELGVDTAGVETPGTQTLTVSPENPLILFDITVALEWDAGNDPSYLQQLEFNLKRASQYLYDFTDGQVALGDVTVTQNADDWAYAEVVIQANNSLRPWANQGGIVLSPTVDLQHPEIVYDSGQVVMGSTWNRYGEPGTSIGDDWSIVLAHELGHYFLFLEDVYLGLDANGLLIPQDSCQGTAMGDPYTDQNNSEFIWDDAYWQANCADTLANQTLQRNEWETIDMWYPELSVPTATNPGPGLMPFSLTDIQVYEPLTATNALEDPTFYLDYIGNGLASNQAQVYLQRNLDSDDIYDFVIPLGGPLGGQNRIKAHGAQPGDRLCAFDPEHQYFGCEEIVEGDDRLSLQRNENWQPVIQLTPVTTTTFDVAVSNVPEGLPLKAQLYPELGYSYAAIDLSWDGTGYSGSFQLDLPEMAGHIAVWVDEAAQEESPRREAMVAYSVGGNPGASRRASTDLRGGGGASRRASTDLRGGGGASRRASAPVVSADGQMTFYTRNPIVFPEGEFYTIQTMAGLPNVPPGRTVIGQGYSLVTTAGAPALDGSISFEYLTGDVRVEGIQEAAEADDLKIYFWDGTGWEMLPTTIDAYYNLASAPGRGAGVYALMASTEIALFNPGWNLIAYPIRGSQPVAEALRSIEGFYSQVYGFEPDGRSDPWTPYIEGSGDSPWRRYDVSLPDWANTLSQLEFGRGYWININGATTIYLGDNDAQRNGAATQATMPPPPATFYGSIEPEEGFVPQTGMELLAKVGDSVCGRAVTQEIDGQVVYVMDVLAAGSGASAGCGSAGSRLSFELAGMPLGTTATWDNSRSHILTLNLTETDQRIYLPLVAR